MKTIKVYKCRECPHLKRPWNSCLSDDYACGYHKSGFVRPKPNESNWLGGDAKRGDKKIKNVDIIQSWCELDE